MACQYKYQPPGQTQEIWVTEEELKMFFNGIPPTINWWEEPGFKERNPNFDATAYVNNVNKFGQDFENLPEKLTPSLTEEIEEAGVLPKEIEDSLNSFVLFDDVDKLCSSGICNNTAYQSTKKLEEVGLNPFPNPDGSSLSVTVKSPIGDFDITHYVTAVAIGDGIYIYDMPQHEFLDEKFFGFNASIPVKTAYKPRLIPLTINEISANYSISEKEAARFIKQIIENRGSNIAPPFKSYISKNISDSEKYIAELEAQITNIGLPEGILDYLEKLRVQNLQAFEEFKTKKLSRNEVNKLQKFIDSKLKLSLREYVPKSKTEFILSDIITNILGKHTGFEYDYRDGLEVVLQKFKEFLKSSTFVDTLKRNFINARDNSLAAKQALDKVYSDRRLMMGFLKYAKVEGIEKAIARYDKNQRYKIRTLLESNPEGRYKSDSQMFGHLQKKFSDINSYVPFQGATTNTTPITKLFRKSWQAKSEEQKLSTILAFLKESDNDTDYIATIVSNEAKRRYKYFSAVGQTMFQKEGIKQSKASPKTIKKVKEWLHRLSVKIEQIKSEGGINGIASMLENIIEIAEGKEDVAITEEAFHFAVGIIELTNPVLFKEMMNKIGKYNIYTDVKQLYSADSQYQNDDGSANIPKLKKEAIGKLLSEMYINSEEGQTEHPELLQQAKTWWERILAFFGVLNKKAGFNPFQEAVESFDDLAKEGAPVKILAQKIIDNFTEKPAKDGKQHFKNALIDTFKAGDYQAVVKYFYEQLHAPTNQDVTTSTKTGVNEVFESNPELANQVYEALGFTKKYKDAEKGNLINELKQITEPYLKEFADLFIQANINIPLYYSKGTDYAYVIPDNTLIISKSSYGVIKHKSIIHELLHAATSNNLLTNTDFKNKIEFIIDDIKKSDKQGRITFSYELQNADEFISGLADKAFGNYLKQKGVFDEVLIILKDNISFKKGFKITPQQKQQALQLYSQYLDTIFPDSKVKDIVYHGSDTKIDRFDKKFIGTGAGTHLGRGFYFATSKDSAKFYTETVANKTLKSYNPSIINLTNPQESKALLRNPDYVNYDGVKDITGQLVVFEPEQIHILGSKQDIEGFKVWAKIKTAPYDIALKQLGGNEELARQIIALGSPYYQLTSEQKALQKEISSRFDKKLVDFQVEKITGKAEFDEQDDTNFYQRAKDGKVGKVSKRVTDFVKESKRPEVLARFEDATPIQKNTYKQKASFGSQFHADAENIIDASTDADGYLKPFNEIDLSSIPTNMHPAAFKALSQYLIGYMEEGEYIPGILQTQFPEGTLFRTETIVYDERKNRDVAGTIDLFGITPNGQIMIYDWKTKFLNTDIYSDIPFFSQQDYKIQLSQYKRILESYNLKDTDKEKAVIVAQAMPIIFKGRVDKKTGDVELSAITFPEVDIKQETKRYLLPVAIDEQSSGNIKVDEYIKALEKLHQTLYKQKDLNKVLKIEQLNAISGAIRELQVKQEFGPLAEQGLLFLKGAERLMLDINTQLKDGGKYIDVDKTKLEEYRGRIKNVVDNIHKYQSTYALFIDIYGKDGLTEKQEDTLKSLERLALDSSVLGKDIEAEYRQFIAHYYANKEGINLLKTEKPIKGVINRSIQSLSRMQNVALQYLRTVTSRANFEKQKNAISKQEEFEALLKPFEQLASSKGLSKKDAFILIAGKNKLGKPMNQLMNRIKTEFYTEFKKAISSEQPDVDWIKENINLEKWQEAKDKDIESFNKQVDDSIYVIGDPEQDNIEKTRKKAEYKQRMDISKPSSPGWKREDLKFYIKDEDKWETDEYKAMSADKAALDLYNFIIALNREAKDVGYHDGNYKFSTRFLPWLRASTLDRIKNSGLSAIGDSIKSIYTLTPEEEISYARVDPNTGQIEKRIPAFFTKNFAEEIRDKDGNLEGYDLSDVSTDIGETISMYIEAMYEYKSLSDIEGAVQSVRDIEAGKKAYLLDSKGRIVVEKGTGKLEKDVDNKANVALYDSFVDAILYKQQYSGDSNLSTGVTKMIEKANQYFRLKVFGLNVFTPMTTFIGGNLQGLINSRKLYKGREFLKNEMKIIGNLWGKEGNIEKGLMDYFLPFTENRARLKAERMSLDKIQRFSFSDLVMSPIRKTDVLVQMATSLSILNNTIVIDGQLINAREYVLNSPEFRDRYKNNTAKSLEKTYEERVRTLINQKGVMKLAKFNEKGLLEIEGVDRDSETTNKLRLKILNEIRTITGNLSEENKIDADRNILLKSVMMFKRWIPPLATNRFGGLQKNVDTNQYEMGRTRMVWNILFDGDGHWFKGIPQGIKTLRDMVAGNSEGIAALEKYYIRTAQTYKERTGNDLEMSPEEFYDMTRRAITQQAKEIGVLLTLLSGFMALKGAGVPDDDETKNFYRVSVRMLDKLTDEISFYYNPLSLQQITTGSWMPSLGLLTDGIKFTNSFRREANAIIFGNEQQAENAHPTKDFFSMIPIANQFFKTFVPLIDAETAKDLGISISTESRRQ